MRKVVLAFLLLTLNSVPALGQTYTFSLSGIKNDYIRLDSIANANKKLAGSDSSSIQTTTDNSGYYFDKKKIKRNSGDIAKTQVSNSSHVQENKFTVSGTVTDCQTKKPIKDVVVKLIGNDGASFETKSDTGGYYLFANCIKPNINYIASTQVANDIGRSEGIKYGICPDEFHETHGYLNSSEKYKFKITDSTNGYQEQIHFCLTPILACGPAPSFYFKKNSTDFLNAEWVDFINADTAIDCFVGFLMAHKSWVLELSAHSSKDEKNKKELAEARAKKLLDLMVSKGIEPERLVYRSYSDTRPIEFGDDTYGKVIKKSAEITNEKSRRVTFSALRKDYVPK